ITIPATVGLIILRVPIIRVLFQRGRFDSQSVEMTAYPLIFFGLGLSIFAAIRVIAPSFYSLKDTKTPVKTAAAAMAANVILALILITPFQHGGIALALTLSSCLNLFLLLHIFQKRHGSIGKRELLISLVKIAIASLVMGAVCWWLTEFTNIAAQQRFLTQLWQLIMIILASVACYVIMTLILRSEEIKELLGVIFRREITLPKD
ncbi:MAG: polysaccharide biosynthesis C-terminal domain-containing protein, partial [Candidatus Aminicenantes bacterium]|nr:polysaccharide biosynthesis C-terminal domain-containing protein [Candidatus Aminicenantes bacterium]